MERYLFFSGVSFFYYTHTNKKIFMETMVPTSSQVHLSTLTVYSFEHIYFY